MKQPIGLGLGGQAELSAVSGTVAGREDLHHFLFVPAASPDAAPDETTINHSSIGLTARGRERGRVHREKKTFISSDGRVRWREPRSHGSQGAGVNAERLKGSNELQEKKLRFRPDQTSTSTSVKGQRLKECRRCDRPGRGVTNDITSGSLTLPVRTNH